MVVPRGHLACATRMAHYPWRCSRAVRIVPQGATRKAGTLVGRTRNAFLDAARRLSQQLAVSDEVDP